MPDTSLPTGSSPSAPITPVANPALNAIPGETVDQYETRLGSMNAGPGTGFGTPSPAQPVTDLQSAQDEAAKSMGFNSYQDAISKIGPTSQSTTDFYNNAYSSAGLDALLSQINSRKSDLDTATGKINDNPWLDEASRVGRVKSLQDLANADIKNLQDEYNGRLKSVQDLVSNHDKDVAQNQQRLTLLEAQAKDLAAEAATKQKDDSTAPKTIKGPNGSTYQWNPNTKTFTPLFAGTPGGKPINSGTMTITSEDLANGQQRLEASRGKDGYANTKTYTDMMNYWTNHGGLLQDFLKLHPPPNYLNPDDPTVPSYLRSTNVYTGQTTVKTK